MEEKMKILIIGAKGMLGTDLAKVLSDYDLVLWDKKDIDITDFNHVQRSIPEVKPDLIINCAAYTAVDACEQKEYRKIASQVNADAVYLLAVQAKNLNIPLMHISTDYVFDGKSKNGYDEDSQAFGPQSVYGKTKYLGEKLLKENLTEYYLIRTSWLYGQHGKNFVDTMLRLGREKDQLQVINDQFGKPTYTLDLAQQIKYIIDKKMPYGIYHVTNETMLGGITWYEFACKIFELAGIDIQVKPCSADEYPRPAPRPAYSALINTKLPQIRSWDKALQEYLTIKEK